MRSGRQRALVILLMSLIMVKGVLLVILWPDIGSRLSWSKGSAEAGTPSQGPAGTDMARTKERQAKDAVGKDGVADLKELIQAIQQKQKELEEKERSLKLKEEQLLILKEDIEKKLALLKEEAAKLKKLMEKKAAEGEERILKLAKVFESTPPEQAGPILGSLDTKVAARILLKMNGRKAGKIWGYVNPQKAIKISQELAKKE